MNVRRNSFYSLKNGPGERNYIPNPKNLSQEIITVNSEIPMKHVSALCGQEVEFLSDKPGSKQSNKINLQKYNKLATN